MNPLLHDFLHKKPLLFDLAAGMHPDRWAALGLPPGVQERLCSCPRSRRLLSAGSGWAGRVPEARWDQWNMSPGRREAWALLSGEDLWRCGLRFGAARFRESVARLVLRDEVRALKSSIGADAYDFAMRQAVLVWRNAALDEAGGEGASLAENILATAFLALGCWLTALPADLAARARLKLPPAVDAALAVTVEWPESRLGGWLAVLDRIVERI